MAEQKILVRPESPEDAQAVYEINTAAFGRPDEARLVDILRPDGSVLISLVAEIGGRLAGHVLFTTVSLKLDGGGETAAAGLGPVAVLPDNQNRGIGSALILDGLRRLRQTDLPFCVVLGHSTYYPRFGFKPSTLSGIRCQWQVPEEAFMAQALRPGGLTGCTGIVYYADPFQNV